ncbi:3' terminal RNA ribose 2'-O-methyltransferase Hen1 [Stackebrandtia albiflava]|uniref:Small RNA 2'-O-methyltransferase n=1 Tax=Stackebrandtia albiflava TaxID=406432 RepID=A0A562V3F2_9ACTN|nr:3' terminal RNA ribose 2'-O-methyltransferase Hen1 [Stackebrandtia albiflava]
MTITTTASPATDLGYLLYKHPDRVANFSQSFGTATVFYPRADAETCTAALLLEVDPIRLVKSRGRQSPDFSLGQYVNDRPYAASSLFAVALGKVFATARSGRCDTRPELAKTAIPLELFLPAVPCRGGVEVAHRLFAPLGWEVDARPVPLHDSFPEWGDSRYVSLRLTGTVRLADALNHLYVLLPVLDDAKHYWIDIGEVDKLVRSGGGWLAAHPARNLITRRYLGNRRGLHRVAHARLAELDESGTELDPPVEEESAPEPSDDTPDAPAPTVPLATRRHEAVLAALRDSGAARVIDLGCGSGKLLELLAADPRFTTIAGTDASTHALRLAERRLRLDRAGDRMAARINLFQGALTYHDDRFSGYDAAVLMEVIEHVDPPRLAALTSVVFGSASPATVVVTTPNVEYNRVYEMPDGALRHPDHRFEWDRAQFAHWAEETAARYGYRVDVSGVGEEDAVAGHPTQMGVFRRG